MRHSFDTYKVDVRVAGPRRRLALGFRRDAPPEEFFRSVLKRTLRGRVSSQETEMRLEPLATATPVHVPATLHKSCNPPPLPLPIRTDLVSRTKPNLARVLASALLVCAGWQGCVSWTCGASCAEAILTPIISRRIKVSRPVSVGLPPGFPPRNERRPFCFDDPNDEAVGFSLSVRGDCLHYETTIADPRRNCGTVLIHQSDCRSERVLGIRIPVLVSGIVEGTLLGHHLSTERLESDKLAVTLPQSQARPAIAKYRKLLPGADGEAAIEWRYQVYTRTSAVDERGALLLSDGAPRKAGFSSRISREGELTIMLEHGEPER